MRMTAPQVTAEPPCRRPLLRPVLAGLAWGVLLAVALETGRVFVGGNIHAVIPGRAYRCSQPSPEGLERLIRAYHIRTLINLRGCANPFPWYLDECRVTQRLDIAQEDVCFSAGRLPSVAELRHLLEVLDHCDYPILFHCQRGADRTGLTAAIVLMLQSDLSFAEARRQLGLRYGHLALGRPANLDWFFDLYARWLGEHGLAHSRANFRRWAEHEYCPGPCRCRLESLNHPACLSCGRPAALRFRAHNTSGETWRLSAGNNAGIHLMYNLYDDACRLRDAGRAGLFRAEVPPGGSIDLTVALPALHRPGRYLLMVDMMDEQQCAFYQTGSEPLEEELDVREQETAPGL
jgi:undecaprenyl-diphosphatase